MLVKRLRTICDVEELATENKHLALLVDTAEGDLRSCLNTLQVRPAVSTLVAILTQLLPQFIKRNGSVVDPKAIQSSALGSKDTGTSSSQVLDRLFKKPPRKRGAPAEGGVGVDERYVHRIVKDVQTSGEYEKISQGAFSFPPFFTHSVLTPSVLAGCFENYLVARGTNAESFPRIEKALDWLFLYDRLDSRLRSEREYELLAYVPYSFAPWYSLFSSQVPKEVERPKTDYEVRRRPFFGPSPCPAISAPVLNTSSLRTDVPQARRPPRSRRRLLAEHPSVAPHHVHRHQYSRRASPSPQSHHGA